MDFLTPQFRVAVAVLPFLAAVLARVIFGRRIWARGLLTVATLWFLINVLLAPYSRHLRLGLLRLGSWLY